MTFVELPLDLIHEINEKCESKGDYNSIFVEALRRYLNENQTTS